LRLVTWHPSFVSTLVTLPVPENKSSALCSLSLYWVTREILSRKLSSFYLPLFGQNGPGCLASGGHHNFPDDVVTRDGWRSARLQPIPLTQARVFGLSAAAIRTPSIQNSWSDLMQSNPYLLAEISTPLI